MRASHKADDLLVVNGITSWILRQRIFWHVKPSVQGMNTRLLSATLDFDSRIQHVSCCVSDECPDS